MSKRKLDNRIPEELARDGWKLRIKAGWVLGIAGPDRFYLYKTGIKTATSNTLETAVEAARRIASGAKPGILVAKRPRRKRAQEEAE